jgi:hypothetical protein
MYNGLKPGTPEFVDRLKPYMPDVTFLEVKPANWGEYISKEELCDRFYDKSMVYIDFSGFEGRELMPREACLRNCVVFLGNEGTAETFDDYPLDDYYKLNRYDNLEEVASKIYNALDNYEKHLENQWFFRNKCECEPIKWEWVTTQLFGKLYKNNE